MTIYTEWNSATPVANFRQAALQFPNFATPASPVQIALRILTYKGVTRGRETKSLDLIPNYDSTTNRAYASAMVSTGKMGMPKIQLSGEIDSPIDPVTAMPTTTVAGYSANYAEMIAAYLEGRIAGSGSPATVHPDWFRDPFGRTFSGVRIEHFDAAMVENVPGRATFNMTLRVFNG